MITTTEGTKHTVNFVKKVTALSLCQIGTKKFIENNRYLDRMCALSKKFLAFQFVAAIGATCLYAAQIAPSPEALSSSGRVIEYSTIRPEGKIVFLRSEKVKETLLSKSAPPVSIRSVNAKITLLHAQRESLRSVTSKSGTIFGFSDQRGQLHFFSTKGGYLSVTSGKNSTRSSLKDWIARVRIEEGAK